LGGIQPFERTIPKIGKAAFRQGQEFHHAAHSDQKFQELAQGEFTHIVTRNICTDTLMSIFIGSTD